ncbi:MAG TPA: SRPBCC domain-containing protein [Acidisarcina sp.]
MSEQMVAEDLKLELKRIIRADRSRVFAAWTKPELISKWFGPGTMIVPSAEADARPSGKYCIEMKRTEPATVDTHLSDTFTVHGIYQQVVPDELLVFTWRWDFDPLIETLVTVRFSDVQSGGTEVTLLHEHFASANTLGRHEHGWTGSLAKLASILEKEE